MVTLKQIARECGVSVATVSKSLNYMPDIGSATAERIRKKAQEMGYHPNTAARALKTNRSYSIGLLFEDNTGEGLTHEYYATVFNSVRLAAEAAGYSLTFMGRVIGGRYASYLESCQYRSIDGVLIISADYSSPMVLELVNSGMPVVTMNYVFNNCSAVVSDNIQGVQDIVQHVYDLGHRRIAFIHGEDCTITRARLASFHRFCQSKGIDVPEEFVLSARYRDPETCRVATAMLMDLKYRPTCILYPDDVSILGGIDVIRRAGMDYPRDLSIVGYDGIRLASQLRTTITTLRQDSVQMGTAAVRLLVDHIENPRTFTPRIVTVSGCLQPGDSTGPVPAGE